MYKQIIPEHVSTQREVGGGNHELNIDTTQGKGRKPNRRL